MRGVDDGEMPVDCATRFEMKRGQRHQATRTASKIAFQRRDTYCDRYRDVTRPVPYKVTEYKDESRERTAYRDKTVSYEDTVRTVYSVQMDI